jgi:hypothetical protein
MLLTVGGDTRVRSRPIGPASLLRQVRSARVVSQLEGLDDEGANAAAARVRALAYMPS